MKRYILLHFVLILTSYGVWGQADNFTINGYVKNYERSQGGIIYLVYSQNNQTIIDSATIRQGRYRFEGTLHYPVKAALKLKVQDSIEQYHCQSRVMRDYSYEFYLDKGNLDATAFDKLSSTTIKGSVSHDDYTALVELQVPLQLRQNSFTTQEVTEAFKMKDSVGMANHMRNVNLLESDRVAIKKKFLMDHPQSGIALDLMEDLYKKILEPSEVEPLFDALQPALKNSLKGKEFAARIELSRSIAINQKAPDFVLKDRRGNEVKLSSYLGKIVLLDFWGSWCSPCRSTHPHLRTLYAHYKDRGFEIIGVANERGTSEVNYQKWVTALDEDQMTWVNLLEGTMPANVEPVNQKYNVAVYPTKLLIGRDGKILKKFTGNSEQVSRELDDALTQLINN